MPQAGGLSAAYRIRQLGSAPKILMFMTHEFEGLERMIDKCGCEGSVLKSNASHDLLRAVRAVLEGKRFFWREKTEAPSA